MKEIGRKAVSPVSGGALYRSARLPLSFRKGNVIMNNLIIKRRSVRFFKDTPIAPENMREILRAGMWAPSPKNRQPWKFIVAKGAKKAEVLDLMEKGLERSEKGEGILGGSHDLFVNARFTLQCMRQAPNLVFVVNPKGRSILDDWTPAEKIHEMSDVQAIGAAAENMALEATALGIGSLWIGNVFFAYEELQQWLGEGEMVLAMSFGYPNHEPCPLARKSEEAVVEVRE